MWLLLNHVDGSAIIADRHDSVAAKSDMRRSKGKRVQARLMQSFKLEAAEGGGGDRDALPTAGSSAEEAMSTKFPGFGLVEPRISIEFQSLGLRLANKDKVVLQGVSGEEGWSSLMFSDCASCVSDVHRCVPFSLSLTA